MKTYRNILALTVLFVAFALNADKLKDDMWLPDGTMIPKGSEEIQSSDLKSYEYRDKKSGEILAQTTQNDDGSITLFVKKNGVWVKLVYKNGKEIESTILGTDFEPTPITPLTSGGGVSGSGNVIAPNGVLLPDSPASVV